MNKKIKIVISILVLLNLVLMVLLYVGRPHRANRLATKELIVKTLNFDKSQKEDFNVLILKHQQDILSIQREVVANKTLLYKSVLEENKAVKDSIINVIGAKFEEIENIHYTHFLEIKRICNDEQLEKFEELSSSFNKMFGSPEHKHRD